MIMEKQNNTVDWIAFNRDLMDCLRTKDNHKYSRYDAFVWLVDNIKKGRLASDKENEQINNPNSGYTASFNHLADQWHWTRQSVAKFIKELEDIAVITHTKDGNYFIFSLDYSSSDKIIL